MNTCTCPKCGKTLEVPATANDFIFCKYCGTQIPLAEHKSAQQQALEDEAEAIVFAEEERKRAERSEACKQTVNAVAEKCKQNPKQALLILVAVLVILVGSTAAITNAIHTHAETASHVAELDRLHEEGEAAVHQSMGEALLPKDGYTGDYRILDKTLRDAGFTDITLIPAKDLILDTGKVENDIIEVTVDGSPKFDKNTWISAETPITIKYHSFITSSDTKISSKAKAEKDALSKKVQDTVDTAKLKVQDAAATAASQALDSILDSLK